ncbi:MAG: hypothetical protein VKI82_01190 [Leptolyngbya sp.]|nr:hypothetical protein [Leptolyngbya sp.]
MRLATVVSVTNDRQLELPPELQEQLTPGDEYIIAVSDNLITFQKIQKPLRFDQLQKHIEALGPDPEEMSLEEISQIVKEVRHQLQSEAEAAECES